MRRIFGPTLSARDCWGTLRRASGALHSLRRPHSRILRISSHPESSRQTSGELQPASRSPARGLHFRRAHLCLPGQRSGRHFQKPFFAARPTGCDVSHFELESSGKKNSCSQKNRLTRKREPFVFCWKLLGYFCAEGLLKLCRQFRSSWRNLDGSDLVLQGALSIAQCKESIEFMGSSGRRRSNLGPVGQSADRTKPHKHWRFCISLIWQVGT
jgi:hypothetical protein